MAELTEKQVKKIAHEEANKVFAKEMAIIREELKKQGIILARLDRLLLGELGTEAEETLKYRASFAYKFAKENTDKRLPERSDKVLRWFEDWNEPEIGQAESKIEILGKVVNSYSSLKWLLGLFGTTTLLGAIPAIKMILEWINNFR